MKGNILLLLWLSISDPAISYDGELLTTMIYFREGEHTPVQAFPEDPLRDHWEIVGYRQLTKQGKVRMYQLGKWLRQRYGDMVPKRYSPDAVRAAAFNYDETIISAYLVLAGLFPPLEDQMFDEEIKWQPIPVHTEPDEEYTFLMSESNVKNMELAILKLIEDSETDTEWLNDVLGVKIESDVNLYGIMDSVIAAKNLNYEGKWTSDETVEVLQNLVVSQLRSLTSTPDLVKWKLEPFFNEIHRRFSKYVKDEDDCNCGSKYNVVLFAGNLEMMVNMLHGLQVVGLLDIPEQVPYFGDTLIFELKEGNAGKRYVQIFYKNSEGNVVQYPVNDCGLECDSEIFIEKLDVILNNDSEISERPMETLRRFKRTEEISNITVPYDQIFTEPNQFII